MPLAARLWEDGSCHLSLAGGELYREPGLIYAQGSGPPDFYASKLFFGAQGIGPNGIMESHPLMARTTEGLVRATYERAGTSDPTNRSLFVDFETLLPDQVLAFVDRLSMAHSVEVRNPFLDFRLMEFVGRIPGRMKIRNGRVKHLLKRAVADLLPEGIIERPKEGFLMPINDWLMGNLQPFVRSILDPTRLALHGLLDPAAIERMIVEHYQGKRRNGDRLWNLMMFQMWWEAYQENGARV
jgi:asparagine synthase (glutamine-hydrolysing)